MLHNTERSSFPSVTRFGFTYSLQPLRSALLPVAQGPEGLGALDASTRRPLTCFSPRVVLRAFPSSRQDL